MFIRNAQARELLAARACVASWNRHWQQHATRELHTALQRTRRVLGLQMVTPHAPPPPPFLAHVWWGWMLAGGPWLSPRGVRSQVKRTLSLMWNLSLRNTLSRMREAAAPPASPRASHPCLPWQGYRESCLEREKVLHGSGVQGLRLLRRAMQTMQGEVRRKALDIWREGQKEDKVGLSLPPPPSKSLPPVIYRGAPGIGGGVRTLLIPVVSPPRR